MRHPDPKDYNYPVFRKAAYEPLQAFWKTSPKLGEPAPDFPLWRLDDEGETRLSELWSRHAYLVVEFGSFT